MNREEAIHRIQYIELYMLPIHTRDDVRDIEALEMAIKALERESKEYERERHCDCCGVLLTEDNNTCGYELCDECNERLEQSMERSRNEI